MCRGTVSICLANHASPHKTRDTGNVVVGLCDVCGDHWIVLFESHGVMWLSENCSVGDDGVARQLVYS